MNSPHVSIAGRIIAPYITAWSREPDLPYRLVESSGGGIGYADEFLGDRDEFGVLWARVATRPDVGRPEFARVHPLRQREAMNGMLCQVCAEPVDRDDDGVLWLLRKVQDEEAHWPEGVACTEPPTCTRCVPVALRLCPALQRGAMTVRVRQAQIIGVRGALYGRGLFAPKVVAGIILPYGDPTVRRMVASALVRELRGCTVVPLPEAGI